MKAFTFETNGNNTFLVYSIQEDDVLDTMTLGMITNNKIPGLSSVLYTQMNRDRFLKYNVTAKVTVKQFFAGIVNKRRLLGVFSSITAALALAEEYMIDSNTLLLDTNYIYADVSTCKAEMICLPVMQTAGTTDAGMFFKNIMFSTQFDQTENCDYVARIINYLNSAPVFVADDFGHLLEELQRMPSAASVNYEKPAVQQAIQQPVKKNPFGGRKAQEAQQSQNQQAVQPVPATAAKPVPQASAQSQQQKAAPQPVAQPHLQDNVVGDKANPAVLEKGNSNGFAVPGQNNNAGFVVPGTQAPPIQNKHGKVKQSTAKTQDKEMSVFYLLQHYNKENAAAYKAQREAKKQSGKAAPAVNNVPAADSGFVMPGQPAALQQPQAQMQQASARPQVQQAISQPQMSQHPAQQPMMQPDVRQAHSVSAENFGDTVLMGAADYGEDTVVISEVQAAAVIKPYLFRISNNEKIFLEKPVFHIGKERSYVDYCISGNATISRSHADIIMKDGQCYIVDNNSTNHTYVNGERIPSNTEVPLSQGTRVRLSNEEFEFRTF